MNIFIRSFAAPRKRVNDPYRNRDSQVENHWFRNLYVVHIAFMQFYQIFLHQFLNVFEKNIPISKCTACSVTA